MAFNRELQNRIPPQYLPSQQQQQQIRQLQQQQQLQLQQQLQQQRRGKNRGGVQQEQEQQQLLLDTNWPAMGGDAAAIGYPNVPMDNEQQMPTRPPPSLNTYLPPLPAKYRREMDAAGNGNNAEVEEGGGNREGNEDENESEERDRAFRMRAIYLQQQQQLERQQQLQRQQLLQQQQLHQHQQQYEAQLQQLQQQQQQQQQERLNRERMDQQRRRVGAAAVPATATAVTAAPSRDPDYDLPRKIHRELQPPSAAVSAAITAASLARRPNGGGRGVHQNAGTSSAAMSARTVSSATHNLSLPLPPPLPSTARRFEMSSPSGRVPGAPPPLRSEPAGGEHPPPPLAQYSQVGLDLQPPPVAAQPKASKKATQKAPQPRALPQQHSKPGSRRKGEPDAMYFRGVDEEQDSQERNYPDYHKSNSVVRRGRNSGYDEEEDDDGFDDGDEEEEEELLDAPSRRRKASKKRTSSKTASAAASGGGAQPRMPGETKRRCGRKSMNYSSEQKRERNRAAVKKCRQRQALKYDYLQQKAEVLESENRALSDMLVNNVDLEEEKRVSLTRGIQMDILFKIKEIFTQSLPKDFVLDADSIWDLNSVLAVSMPSRCYYGIESIKEFWRTSLRMRNKGKIRSFWAWLFRLPPGDRFTEFDIQPFSPTSNLYFITWTTKSEPPLSGSMVIMFGHGHRVTLHVECFGWLIWRYLLTNEPFPEPLD